MTTEQITEYFQFLDGLRDSGSVNMMRARPVLSDHFRLSNKEALAVLTKWMETFDPDVSPEDRAKQFA